MGELTVHAGSAKKMNGILLLENIIQATPPPPPAESMRTPGSLGQNVAARAAKTAADLRHDLLDACATFAKGRGRWLDAAISRP